MVAKLWSRSGPALAVVLLLPAMALGQAPTAHNTWPSNSQNQDASGVSTYNNSEVITQAQWFVNGTQVQKIRGSGIPGATVKVVFSVSPTAQGGSVQMTLTSYIAPNENWDLYNMQHQTVYQVATNTFSAGSTNNTLSVQLPPNADFQLDFVMGPVIKHLGENANGGTNMNVFYHAQNRFIDGDNGGMDRVKDPPAPTQSAASTSKQTSDPSAGTLTPAKAAASTSKQISDPSAGTSTPAKSVSSTPTSAPTTAPVQTSQSTPSQAQAIDTVKATEAPSNTTKSAPAQQVVKTSVDHTASHAAVTAPVRTIAQTTNGAIKSTPTVTVDPSHAQAQKANAPVQVTQSQQTASAAPLAPVATQTRTPAPVNSAVQVTQNQQPSPADVAPVLSQSGTPVLSAPAVRLTQNSMPSSYAPVMAVSTHGGMPAASAVPVAGTTHSSRPIPTVNVTPMASHAMVSAQPVMTATPVVQVHTPAVTVTSGVSHPIQTAAIQTGAVSQPLPSYSPVAVGGPAATMSLRPIGVGAPAAAPMIAPTRVGMYPTANMVRAPMMVGGTPYAGTAQPVYASLPSMGIGRGTMPVVTAGGYAPMTYGRAAVMAPTYGSINRVAPVMTVAPYSPSGNAAMPVMVSNGYDTTINQAVTVVNNNQAAAPIDAQPIYVTNSSPIYTSVSQPTYVFVSLSMASTPTTQDVVTVPRSGVPDSIGTASVVKVDTVGAQPFASQQAVKVASIGYVPSVEIPADEKTSGDIIDEESEPGSELTNAAVLPPPAPKSAWMSILGSPVAILGIGGGTLLLAVGGGAFWALQSSSKKSKRRVVRRRTRRA